MIDLFLDIDIDELYLDFEKAKRYVVQMLRRARRRDRFARAAQRRRHGGESSGNKPNSQHNVSIAIRR